MRARRLSRLAGLVLALAVTLGVVAGWSGGGFSAMDYEWGGAVLDYEWGTFPLIP
ncbi:hypothetical protein GCM10023170_006640 [Phytohabitans houttuyneae]|jgi:hypothetical protein|uniref:hypothetical protein n=1 Tax=Phytohabitans houttuyneae TaxID=1076126 RepID=UPI0031E7B8B6